MGTFRGQLSPRLVLLTLWRLLFKGQASYPGDYLVAEYLVISVVVSRVVIPRVVVLEVGVYWGVEFETTGLYQSQYSLPWVEIP